MGKAKRNRERRRSVATEISSEATRRGNTERTVITPGGLEMSEGLARLAGIEPSEDADR